MVDVLRTILSTSVSFKQGDVYFQGGIPPKMLENAVVKYGAGVNPDSVILLYNGTVFGSAKDGFFMTPTHLYYHNWMEDACSFPLSAVLEVSLVKSHLTIETKPGASFKSTHKMFLVNFSDDEGQGLVQLIRAYIETLHATGAVEKKTEVGAVRGGSLACRDDCVAVIADAATSAQLSDENVFIGMQKPSKVRNAVEKYGCGLIRPEDVLVLYDNTVFGTARDGCCYSSAYFGFNNMGGSTGCCSLDDIKRVRASNSSLIVERHSGADMEAIFTLTTSTTKRLAQQFADVMARFLAWRAEVRGAAGPGLEPPAPAGGAGAGVDTGATAPPPVSFAAYPSAPPPEYPPVPSGDGGYAPPVVAPGYYDIHPAYLAAQMPPPFPAVHASADPYHPTSMLAAGPVAAAPESVKNPTPWESGPAGAASSSPAVVMDAFRPPAMDWRAVLSAAHNPNDIIHALRSIVAAVRAGSVTVTKQEFAEVCIAKRDAAQDVWTKAVAEEFRESLLAISAK